MHVQPYEWTKSRAQHCARDIPIFDAPPRLKKPVCASGVLMYTVFLMSPLYASKEEGKKDEENDVNATAEGCA